MPEIVGTPGNDTLLGTNGDDKIEGERPADVLTGGSGADNLRYQNCGANLLVQLDTDGNGVADMKIVLQGFAGQTLTGGSFVP